MTSHAIKESFLIVVCGFQISLQLSSIECEAPNDERSLKVEEPRVDAEKLFGDYNPNG
jgi:hypothetical protein